MSRQLSAVSRRLRKPAARSLNVLPAESNQQRDGGQAFGTKPPRATLSFKERANFQALNAQADGLSVDCRQLNEEERGAATWEDSKRSDG
jgi:hypothetical protein